MNYGKIVRLKFNGKVWYVSSKEKTQFRLLNVYDECVYPINVTYGANDHEIYLHFDNVNLFGANRIECFETIKMGSEDVHIEAFIREVFLEHLMPCDTSHIELSNVEVSGGILVAFDGKGYFVENTSYYAMSDTVTTTGTLVALVFNKGYFVENTSYYAMSDTVTITGQYCDINGVPL